MDPKLDEAFRKAIKAYFEDADLTEYNKAHGERKYSKKYFDSVEQEKLGQVYPKLSKHKKKEVKDADKSA